MPQRKANKEQNIIFFLEKHCRFNERPQVNRKNFFMQANMESNG